jgi:hypothetical protein
MRRAVNSTSYLNGEQADSAASLQLIAVLINGGFVIKARLDAYSGIRRLLCPVECVKERGDTEAAKCINE